MLAVGRGWEGQSGGTKIASKAATNRSSLIANGAVAGALIGGPVGAAVGATVGAAAGGAAAAIDPPPRVHTYVTGHQVQPVYLDGEVIVGEGVPASLGMAGAMIFPEGPMGTQQSISSRSAAGSRGARYHRCARSFYTLRGQDFVPMKGD